MRIAEYTFHLFDAITSIRIVFHDVFEITDFPLKFHLFFRSPPRLVVRERLWQGILQERTLFKTAFYLISLLAALVVKPSLASR